MADNHDHDHHEPGAHEIDKMPTGRLFNLLFGFSAVTLLACIGVVQMFNLQVESIENNRAAKGSFSQREYLQESTEIRDGFGKYEAGVGDNASDGFFVPMKNARKQLLDNPALLGGATPDAKFGESGVAKQIKDWGGMPTAAKPAAVPAKPVPRPAVPAGAKPAGAKPAGAKPAGAQPAGAKPAGAKPAGAQPAGAKPAGAKPAGAKPAGAKPAAEKPATPKPAGGAK